MASFRMSHEEIRGSLTSTPGPLLDKLKQRISSINYKIDSQEAAEDSSKVLDGMSIQREQVTIDNKLVNVRKLYLEDSPLGGSLFYKVGWVVDRDVSCCMICSHSFGWFRYRHHCRACGILVCYKCSPFIATVSAFAFEEPSGSRVCKNCFGLKT